MKKKIRLILFISLVTTLKLLAQTEPEITVSFLANDKIADVNIDQDKYIKSMGEVLALVKAEFKDIAKEQKIAIILISHKIGNPTFEFYSKPAIESEKELRFLKELRNLHFEHTKFVDFPVLLNVNVKDGMLSKIFNEMVLPMDKTNTEYENASLKKKYELNKIWAINEVLPILSAYQTIVDDKFLGVKNFGTLIATTNFSESQNLINITSKNANYWRASVEMSVGNQLIPATKIFALIAQGEFDYAIKYLEIVNMFSDPKSIANIYLSELTWRLSMFNKQLNTEIKKGIVEHDKGNYQNAINVYHGILETYPNSAWSLYELYYSQNALELKNEKIKLEDRMNWDKAKSKIFKCNPLYNMNVRASNAKEGYLLLRCQEISNLFKNEEERLNDIYKYADIAMDIEVYDFAAQLFWYSFTSSKDNDKALNKFLYCLEQIGVTNLKENFKGNFEKEFSKIKAEKEQEMTSSAIYQAFKK